MSFTPVYDLESLSDEQKAKYLKDVCVHMGVPDNLGLIMFTYLDDGDGPRRLVPYAKRGATEIIRQNRGINIINLDSKQIGGSIVFTATGKDATGRQEMSTGSKFIADLSGRDLDDAIMTAQTRATRRMTLQFVGAGVLDESEVKSQAPMVSANQLAPTPAPQPVVAQTNEAGKDITQASLDIDTTAADKEALENLEKLRAKAIQELNEQTEPEVKKTRKPRGPNKKKQVDLEVSPSAPVSANVETPKNSEIIPAKVEYHIPLPEHSGTNVVVVPPPSIPASAVTVSVLGTTVPNPGTPPRLTNEELKPFRQRQFKLKSTLELNGLQPSEGVAVMDKLFRFIEIVVPDVADPKYMTTAQWETYLSILEAKLASVGPIETVKYIEETIG